MTYQDYGEDHHVIPRTDPIGEDDNQESGSGDDPD